MGTSIVSTIPLKTETNAYSLPEYFTITGKVVSMEVAPPLTIGARFPKYFASRGVNNNVNISRLILESKAIIPKALPDNWVIIILERL